MKASLLTAALLSASLVVTHAATTIFQYDYSASNPDPTSQGWTYSGAGAGYADSYDAGTGWRTVDGTTTAFSNYEQSLSAVKGALTTAPEWTLSWTIALDRDATTRAGATVANYYAGSETNNKRQNDIAVLLDIDDTYRFLVTHTVMGDNVWLDFGGVKYETQVALGEFATYSLSYNKALNTATLDYGGLSPATVTVTPSDPGRDAFFFGAVSVTGQGSAIWQDVTLSTIPEPSAAVLLGLGAFACFRRRR